MALIAIFVSSTKQSPKLMIRDTANNPNRIPADKAVTVIGPGDEVIWVIDPEDDNIESLTAIVKKSSSDPDLVNTPTMQGKAIVARARAQRGPKTEEEGYNIRYRAKGNSIELEDDPKLKMDH